MSDEQAHPPSAGGQIQLILGAGTAPVNRQLPVLLWGIATVVIGVTIAVLLTQGQIRALVLLMLSILGILCLSPKRGVYIILVFLPFMYFLRRQVLYFNDFAQTDPILLFPPLVTIAIFLGFIIFYTDRFFRYLQHSLLLKLLIALQVLYFAEMFNPAQGNILVGIAGAIYFIIPILWVYPGMLLVERDIRRIFMIIIVIGTITAAYGVYQHFFGLSDVERYEMEAKNFLIMLGDKPRVMSTFASMGDFSLYISVAAFLAFAHYWRTKRNPLYFFPIALIICALLWVAVRATMFMLIFSVIMFLIVYARDRRRIVVRAVLAIVVIGSIYSYLYTYTPEEIWQVSRSKDPYVVHTISGMAHPTQESSFSKRLLNWEYIVKSSFTEFPAGRGLGSTTTAARKFAGGKGTEADSMFFELMYGSSPLAAILFVLIALVLFRDALTLAIDSADPFVFRVAFGVLASSFMGSVFGQNLRDVVSSPFAWLLIGWLIREIVDRRASAPPQARAAT